MSLHHTTTGDSRHHQLLCEQFLYFHLMLCGGRKPWPDLWRCPWHRFLQSEDHIWSRKTVADRGFEGFWFWWGFCAIFFLQIYEIPVSILLLKIMAVRLILQLSDCNYMYKSFKRCEHFFAICRGTKRNCDDGNFQILVN